MFTGLIQEKGHIKSIQRQSHTIKLSCYASKKILSDYHIGDSMAINGVCLTAVEKNDSAFTVDIMPETFKKTTFSTLKVGSEVNLERAMLSIQRFEGHLVSGHIDTTTRLIQKRKLENALLLTFVYPEKNQGEIIPQGSIAINGVSLTVTTVKQGTFSVSLIPHSTEKTTLENLKLNELVNLETDMIGKYVKAQKQLFNILSKEGLI